MVTGGRYFRSVRPGQEKKIWSGEGGLYSNSRWLPLGHAVAYAAESPSLSVLESLVNAPKPWPKQLYFSSIDLPLPSAAGVNKVRLKDLPTDWRKLPRGPGPLWDIGLAFMASSAFALLVPSAVMPKESNLIVKIGHPGFAALITPTTPELELMDERLVE